MIRIPPFATFISLLAFAACSSSEDPAPENTAGTGGTSSAAGSSGAGAPGAAGTATGGAGGGGADGSGGGAGGASGSSRAVTGGVGGEAPMAGAGGDGGGAGASEEPMGMGFFATSVGSGAMGGNLGGLAGADAICQGLAEAVDAGGRTWHAYLSSSTEDARDRIGTGPWLNQAGEVIAMDVESLHTDGLSNGDPQHVLDENGDEVPMNEHDILTGSTEMGTVVADATCQDWTSNGTGDVAQVGHSDIPQPQFSPSWNAAHTSQDCSQAGLVARGGSGRLYCFAID